MPITAVSIEIDRQARSVAPGATRGQALINLASLVANEQLLLEVQGDVDIPLAPADVLFLRGGEKFSIGDGQPVVADNPAVRTAPAATLNDQPLASPGPHHTAKMTGAHLKAVAGGGHLDLWVDLDGLADELVDDADRIVLQPRDRFFTVPRQPEDRFYEVTVILDGEDRQRRFPAGMTVQQAIRRSLPPRDRPQVTDFEMVDGNLGPLPLDSSLTLKSAGVRDGHILSITKKTGGGG